MVNVGVLRRRWYSGALTRWVARVDGGPPRSRRARLRAIRHREGSVVATVVLASLMKYDGSYFSAPETSSSIGRYAFPLTNQWLRYVAPNG